MGSNSTSIAVGCAVGIPCFVAFCVALIFFLKTRKRFKQEDLEYSKDVNDMDQDLSYNNLDQLKIEKTDHYNNNSEPSEDSDQSRQQQEEDYDETEQKNSNDDSNSNKKQRYTPAYRKKFKSSMTNLNNSRNSSFSNLPNGGGVHKDGSNSSINSSNTNQTEFLYNNIPMMDRENIKQADSSNNSMDLARSLQQPTPSYTKKPSNQRSLSVSSNGEEDYDLKNNYKVDNDDEIQEEDQYENEFTNYSENKRAYINSLRPK